MSSSESSSSASDASPVQKVSRVKRLSTTSDDSDDPDSVQELAVRSVAQGGATTREAKGPPSSSSDSASDEINGDLLSGLRAPPRLQSGPSSSDGTSSDAGRAFKRASLCGGTSRDSASESLAERAARPPPMAVAAATAFAESVNLPEVHRKPHERGFAREGSSGSEANLDFDHGSRSEEGSESPGFEAAAARSFPPLALRTEVPEDDVESRRSSFANPSGRNIPQSAASSVANGSLTELSGSRLSAAVPLRTSSAAAGAARRSFPASEEPAASSHSRAGHDDVGGLQVHPVRQESIRHESIGAEGDAVEEWRRRRALDLEFYSREASSASQPIAVEQPPPRQVETRAASTPPARDGLELLQDERLWQQLTPEEAKKMKGMLQAVTLYRQQLQKNENLIGELQAQIAGKEKTTRTLRRRVQQAAQETQLAEEQEANAQQELERWEKKRRQYEAGAEGASSLLKQVQHTQAECNRLHQQLAPRRNEVQALRDRRLACEASGREQAIRLATLKGRCQQDIAQLKAEQSEELAALQANHMEELVKLETRYQNQAADLRAESTEEAARLRLQMEDAVRRREQLRQERDEAQDQLRARQREGSLLQQQCAEARQEVLDLTVQAKAFHASGSGMFGGDALPTDTESEIQAMWQHCKTLERDCARMHDALEKKQVECEQWRKRASEPLRQLPSTVRRDECPFTLGPSETSEAGLVVLRGGGL
mmetsp:Transcript_48166/g.112664  ORF Transcript_48166/g.112664 Transcript_48166/m.112664 type:complete len:715 (-) Transcript_48166:73-2217(-)